MGSDSRAASLMRFSGREERRTATATAVSPAPAPASAPAPATNNQGSSDRFSFSKGTLTIDASGDSTTVTVRDSRLDSDIVVTVNGKKQCFAKGMLTKVVMNGDNAKQNFVVGTPRVAYEINGGGGKDSARTVQPVHDPSYGQSKIANIPMLTFTGSYTSATYYGELPGGVVLEKCSAASGKQGVDNSSNNAALYCLPTPAPAFLNNFLIGGDHTRTPNIAIHTIIYDPTSQTMQNHALTQATVSLIEKINETKID